MTDAEKAIREALAAVERGFHVEIKSVDIAALLAEMDRLRADAERMDFMEINGLGCDSIGSLGFFVYHNCIQYHGTTARAAIDAARGKE